MSIIDNQVNTTLGIMITYLGYSGCLRTLFNAHVLSERNGTHIFISYTSEEHTHIHNVNIYIRLAQIWFG